MICTVLREDFTNSIPAKIMQSVLRTYTIGTQGRGRKLATLKLVKTRGTGCEDIPMRFDCVQRI